MAKSHDTVAHEWAHQAARGNAARGHHMFYDGETIYSYGAHFAIARLVTRGASTCVLFTTRRYSVSTAKHITITRRACSHLLTFDVPFITGTANNHAGNMASYRDEVKGNIERASRRRSPTLAISDLQCAERACDDALAYAKWFKLDRRKLAFRAPTMPSDLGGRLDTLRKKHKDELAVMDRMRALRNAEIERDIIPRWRAGEAVSIPYEYSHGTGVYIMRVRGDDVETSGNAHFSVNDARAVWPVLQRLRSMLNSDKGDRVAAFLNGRPLPKLGFYQINSVSKWGVRAGCHVVEWQEIDRIAGELGLTQ